MEKKTRWFSGTATVGRNIAETVLIYLLSEKIHLPIGTSINRDVQLLVETKFLLPQEP
jgi:hypothetical protein